MRTALVATSLVAAVVLCTISPTLAWAGDRKEAESYFRRGNTLFEDGRYEEAAKMFKVCVALAPGLAGPYRRLGQAYRELGRCDDAVDQFLKYLDLKPDGKYAESIRRDMSTCADDARRAAAERPLTGQVLLEIDEDDARVLFDGEEVGVSPIGTIAMRPGKYRVNVAKSGYLPWEEELTVEAGETVERSIGLEPAAGGRATTTGRLLLSIDPPGARVVVDGQLVGVSPLRDLDLPSGALTVRVDRKGYLGETHTVDLPANGQATLRVSLVHVGIGPETEATAGPSSEQDGAATSDGGDSTRLLGWTLAAAGTLGAVAGVILGTMALRKSESYSTSDETTNRRALKEEGETLARVADVAFVSAALLGTGGVVILVGAPGTTGASIGFAGTF